MLRGRGCARDGTEQNAESEEAFRLLLLIGNVLKTDSKTKPTSKLNCRVIISSLDESFKVWLIEINGAPACQKYELT